MLRSLRRVCSVLVITHTHTHTHGKSQDEKKAYKHVYVLITYRACAIVWFWQVLKKDKNMREEQVRKRSRYGERDIEREPDFGDPNASLEVTTSCGASSRSLARSGWRRDLRGGKMR